MRKLITLLCLITALVVALGPPGQTAPTKSIEVKAPVLPIIGNADELANTVIQPTPAVNSVPTVEKPGSQTNATNLIAYEKPVLSITELIYFCSDEYTVYCWTDEANANGYPQEGEYPLKCPLTDSITTTSI